MSSIQALILGLVQGLTEFLPVSSSGHLTLVPFIFGWDEPTLAFVVAVHLGTLMAVTFIFRAEVALLMRTALSWKTADERARRMFRLVAIATVPAAVVGVVFEHAISTAFERPVIVSLLLGVTGYVLMSTETHVDAVEGEPRGEHLIDTGDAAVIGVAQAISILPGISRSGSTIAAGMRRGLSRPTAARFSFLMSVPIIFGAVLAQIPDMLKQGSGGQAGAFLIGIVTSAVSGFLAIRWFINVIGRRGLRPFGFYCVAVMVAGLITALARG